MKQQRQVTNEVEEKLQQCRPKCRHRLVLNCQQIANVVGLFLLMTCFSLTSTAPTTSSTTKATINGTPKIQIALVDVDDTTSNLKNPIFTTSSSPVSSVSSGEVDFFTKQNLKHDEVTTTTPKMTMTTTSEVSDVTTDNRILIESTLSQVLTTTVNNVDDVVNVEENKKIQNIQQISTSTTTTIEKPIKLDADNFAIMDEERDASSTPNGNGGNIEKKMKMKEKEISTSSKKKALKADKKLKLKQQKISLDSINHPTIVPTTNEPSETVTEADVVHDLKSITTQAIPELTSMKTPLTTKTDLNSDKSTFTAVTTKDDVDVGMSKSEEIETTTTTTQSYSPYPTSIKTAPTTIKSTTRTTIKSSEMESTTLPFTTMAATESSSSYQPVTALNINETTKVEQQKEQKQRDSDSAHLLNQQEHHEQKKQQRNDNVIVLNTNNSGLIVVDIMDNFGALQNNNATEETIEIKMDLIDDVESSSSSSGSSSSSTTSKDDIFLTTLELTSSAAATINPSTTTTTVIIPTETATSSSQNNPNPTTIDDGSKSAVRIDLDVTTTGGANSTPNDDIILINVNSESQQVTPADSSQQPSQIIKWNQVKNGDVNGNIKITFDNVDLPNQNVNVSIENGELVIDSIDIGMLNRAEEVLKKTFVTPSSSNNNNNSMKKSDSLEIELIEDDSDQKEISNKMTSSTSIPTISNVDDEKTSNTFQATTIHFDIPKQHDHSNSKTKIELNGGDIGSGNENEDGIKIKTTDKDSDTIFYMSNAEVKVIESIPTASPTIQNTNDKSKNNNKNKKYRPTMFEEDVIVDVPAQKNRSGPTSSQGDKYEEDIILSPLTSPFDPKDINYIGEAFLDVEESQNGVGFSENRHIIPLTSDVVIQPAQLRDFPPPNGIPIMGEIPPQIELEEMVFSDDYENKQMSNLRLEEYFLNSRPNYLSKNSLEADVPKETILDMRNITFLPNKTHILINTINTINGTNMTTISSSLANGTAFLIEKESDEIENADLNEIQTLLLACFATLTPLFLCVIIALTIRYCWRKYHNDDALGNDLTSDKSTDPLAEKHHVASTDDLKSAESGMKLDGGTTMGTSTELLLTANGEITTPTNHNGNGSIITMTLKNNHLIVETEERNDLSRDTRETKMHYSPSDKDGVFIVEAARGADQNGSHKPSPLQQQKPKEAPLVIPEEIKIDTIQSHFTPSSPEEERKQTKPEQVEVHSPPVDVELKEKVICNGTKTGLSQSDLSLTSSNSSNQNYSYGDKDTYQCEEKGYKGSSPKRIINIHNHDLKPLIENSPPATLQTTVTEKIIPSPTTKKIDNDDDEQPKVHKLNGIIKNGHDEIMTDENFNDAPPPPLTNGCHAEINLDSLSSFPAPPEDVNDPNSIIELTSMDSLPPPPPEMTIEVAQS